MNRIIFNIPVFLLFLNLVVSATTQSNNSICLVEAREYPGWDYCMWDGLYAAENREIYTGLITIVNIRENNCRKNTNKKQIKAGSDQGRSFVPMVVCKASGVSSWRFCF